MNRKPSQRTAAPPDLPPELADLLRRGATLVCPPRAADLGRKPVALKEACTHALANPVGCAPLCDLVTARGRVVIIVSDATRDEPRDVMVRAVRAAIAHVPDEQIALVVASGTHAPRSPATVLDVALRTAHPVVVHDGADENAMVDLGTTTAGTRVRVHHRVAEADLVVVTGRIRPHYFAGYSGGAKGIFPGCALSVDARQNHQWKSHTTARLGRLGDNVCRLDLEEAARKLPGRSALLNVVADVDSTYVDAIAGDLILAHREACRRAAPLFTARGPRAHVVVTSDRPPVTSSLYQAAKLLPPAGAILEPNGTVLLVAGCEEGTGPLATVNEGIYQLGIRHHLPRGHRINLISSLPDAIARTTFATPCRSLAEALAKANLPGQSDLSEVVLLWRAGELLLERENGTQ